jgi:hypothetical protein
VARITTLWIAIVLAGCSTSYEHSVRALRPIPAHWVDDPDVLDPDWADFDFDALSFSTPTDGWIVGNRFLVHIAGDDLTVTFIHATESWLTGVVFTAPEEGWATGFRSLADTAPTPILGTSQGVVWHYLDGHWTASDLTGVDWPNWSASAVFASPRGEVWVDARVALEGDDEHPPAPRRFKPMLLRSDGSRWDVDSSTRLGDRRWFFGDACFDASGDGWFVGMDFADPSAPKALAVRRRHGEWKRVLVPAVEGRLAALSRVVCLPGDRAVAIGSSVGQELVLRYDGEWNLIQLPEAIRNAEVSAVGALSDDDIWLAASWVDRRFDRRPVFLHWSMGEWTEVPPPPLPGGRTNGYSFTDIQFVTPTEGWAIATDYAGTGLSNGLIFHYKDGVWRHRSWSWHLWDMPGFGLFGD